MMLHTYVYQVTVHPVAQSSWLGLAKTIICRLLVKNRGCLHCLILRCVSVVFPYHMTWSHATLCASVSFPDHVPRLIPYHATQSHSQTMCPTSSHTMQLSLIPRPETTMRLSHMMREVTVNRVRVPYHPWVMRVWRPWCL